MLRAVFRDRPEPGSRRLHMNANTIIEAVQANRTNRVLVKTAATLGREDACFLVDAAAGFVPNGGRQ